jgi:D-beta-D-heptose 7-phosphate kinase/D-beta-D-heptose 1-phosphate adenosyltransferase
MIIDRKDITSALSELKNLGKKIVFTNGCFDIIHVGHVQYLTEAKALGDVLVIGLNTDSSVKVLKGPSRPINNEHDRAIVLDSLKPVDYVTFFDEETPYNLINQILPDILVKGGDYSLENIVGADIVLQNGGKVEIIKFVEGKSTTLIIEKMQK